MKNSVKVPCFLSVIGFSLLIGANAMAVTPEFIEFAKLLAGDGASEDIFGYAVGLDGDTAVMGAWGDDSGSAYVFTRTAGVWTEQQKLTPSDAAAFDEFGESVAVDGDTVVVSAWLDDDNADNSGSVYVFTRSAGMWTERLKLLASDGRTDDHLGYFRPGIQLSGSTVLAGAPQDTTPGEAGAACLFDVSALSLMPFAGNSDGGAVGLLTALLLLLLLRWRRMAYQRRTKHTLRSPVGR